MNILTYFISNIIIISFIFFYELLFSVSIRFVKNIYINNFIILGFIIKINIIK